MDDIYPAPATEPGTPCPCRPGCDAVRAVGATYAQGHDMRTASWLVPALGLTGAPRVASTLTAEYGSVGAAHRAYLSGVR